MSTVFVFVVNVCSLPVVISICCSEFYFAVTVVGHRTFALRVVCRQIQPGDQARILNSNVLSVVLYGAEMWRVTTTDLNKFDVCHRTCLRRVLRRFGPNHLSNEELYEATGSTPVSALIRVRRWRWIVR